jgi:hypothetical protein
MPKKQKGVVSASDPKQIFALAGGRAPDVRLSPASIAQRSENFSRGLTFLPSFLSFADHQI